MLCTSCNQDLPEGSFHKQSSSPRGRKFHCRTCTNNYRRGVYDPEKKREEKQREYAKNPLGYIERATERTRQLKQRSLGGKFRAETTAIYKRARLVSKETGVPHHVDHVVPITSDSVCGLHVPWNLEIKTGIDNMKKGNKI